MPPKKWEPQKVIESLRVRHAQAKDMSTTGIISDDRALYKACCNYFGGYRQALEAAGLSIAEHSRQKPIGYWTDERIIARIREIKESGRPINARSIYRTMGDLFTAGCKRFGTWRKAVKAAGYDYDSILAQRQWSKKTIIAEIQTRHSKGLSLKAQDVDADDPNLYSAARRRFREWYVATEIAGFPRASITDREKWSRERILETLKILAEAEEDLSLAYNYELRGRFLIAACREFGTWENALAQIGLDYDEIRKDRYQEAIRGRLFEIYLKDAFQRMKWQLDYHPHYNFSDTTCVPDFSDSVNGSWYDAKVSPWGKKVTLSLAKYQGCSGSIAIIYLGGKQRISKDPSIQFFPVRMLYQELLKSGAEGLVRDLETLRRGSRNPKLQKQLDDFVSNQVQEEKEIIDRIANRPQNE